MSIIVSEGTGWPRTILNFGANVSRYDILNRPVVSLGRAIVIRVPDPSTYKLHNLNVGNAIDKAMPLATCALPDSISYAPGGYKRSECITVSTVSTLPVPYLEHVYNKVRSMLSAKAYLHWYTKYLNDSEDLIRDACFDLYEMINMYRYYSK